MLTKYQGNIAQNLKYKNMKKVLLLSLACMLATIGACTKSTNAYLSKKTYSLYQSQTEKIQGISIDDVSWNPQNEYVATIEDGIITGEYVGTTTVTSTSKNLSFTVEVKPKYNLYDEPELNWGATMSAIQALYGEPISSTSNSLLYASDNTNAPLVMYQFSEGKLSSSTVLVKTDYAETLAYFLSERYVTVSASNSTFIFCHAYGTKENHTIDYVVAVGYQSSFNAIMVVYSPYDETKSSDYANAEILLENFKMPCKY